MAYFRNIKSIHEEESKVLVILTKLVFLAVEYPLVRVVPVTLKFPDVNWVIFESFPICQKNGKINLLYTVLTLKNSPIT